MNKVATGQVYESTDKRDNFMVGCFGRRRTVTRKVRVEYVSSYLIGGFVLATNIVTGRQTYISVERLAYGRGYRLVTG